MSEARSTLETVENNGGGMIISSSCDEEWHHPQFPAGLRVLLIDDNIVCLTVVTALLNNCRYQVTAKLNPAEALMLLKKNEDQFDIVLTDVRMDEIDGFKLLEAGLELDIPVIMMSSSDNKAVIMKGVSYGARDYLIKPLRKEEVKNIWQHVYRKNLLPCTKAYSVKRVDHNFSEHGGEEEEFEDNNACKTGKKSGGSSKRKCVEDIADSGSESGNEVGVLASSGKRERMKWTQPLHKRFVDVVGKLGGVDKAVPKKILEAMGLPSISREQVASHLQKFRKAIKKQEIETRDKIISNNNNHQHNHPVQARILAANNSSQFRGLTMGPSIGRPTPCDNITNYTEPQKQLNNWTVHSTGRHPQSLQAVRQNINPMTMMQPQQIAGSNFEQQQNLHRELKPNLGLHSFESIIQADKGLMLDQCHPYSSIVDPSLEDLPLHGSFFDEDYYSFHADLFRS